MDTSVQARLPFDASLDVEAFLGTTPWVAATDRLPPVAGWWKCRRKDAPDLFPNHRRWFDGTNFSRPVMVGLSDVLTEIAQAIPADPEIQEQIEWCGLTVRLADDAYPYQLLPTGKRRISCE